MNLYATMSFPPPNPYYVYGQGQEYSEYPQEYASRPAYPPIMTAPMAPMVPFQQPAPYTYDHASPAYSSPAYTPAPHIMQYLSPAPSQPLPSPISPREPPRPSLGRAVVIGVNYFNQKGEMKGRIDDARNLSRYLQQIKRYRREDIILLSDDQNGSFSQPTKKNILTALMWLVKNAQPGEKLILYYSGHGRISMKDKKKQRKGSRGSIVSTQDEEMETIYPADFREFKEGMIKPEELEEILKPAKEKGAKITIILDTHAGTR